MAEIYQNWNSAMRVMRSQGCSDSMISDMTTSAKRRIEMLMLPRNLPVEIERGQRRHHLLAGNGEWDVINAHGNPEAGQGDRLIIWLP